MRRSPGGVSGQKFCDQVGGAVGARGPQPAAQRFVKARGADGLGVAIVGDPLEGDVSEPACGLAGDVRQP